jgi:1,4-alpha-glucan branching enzyme
MALKKSYPKTGLTCKVTFELSAQAAGSAKDVRIAGDFNKWDTKDIKTKMIKRDDGSFSKTLELSRGREYQFRYVIDGNHWENDWNADKYVPAPGIPEDNSVVIV